MVNKRGAVHPALLILMIAVGIGIIAYIYTDFTSGSNSGSEPNANDVVKFGDAVGNSNLNFISYIIGSVPSFLIEWTNNVSAAIIILILFFILVFMFSDIIYLFGTFSNQYIAWFIGTGLAIIAANIKLLVYLAVWGFGLAAGLGILSVVVGVGAPFVIYLGLHYVFFKNFSGWIRNKQSNREFADNLEDMTKGIRGIKELGKEMGKR